MSDSFSSAFPEMDATVRNFIGGNTVTIPPIEIVRDEFWTGVGIDEERVLQEIISLRSELAALNSRPPAATGQTEPSVLFRPALSIDGDMWCALYGANLQDGVAGFGKSPALAMADFDANWRAELA